MTSSKISRNDNDYSSAIKNINPVQTINCIVIQELVFAKH